MKKPGNILIVDDNRGVLTAVQLLLKPHFEKIITLTSPVTLTSALREETPSVVLLDMNFASGINTGNEGLFWLQEIKRLHPSLPVVLFTAYGDIDLAVRGIKEGATDFIVKPWDNQKLVETLLNAALPADNRKNRQNAPPMTSSMYWGESSPMQQLRSLVEKVSVTDANILITGENGTGKEMLAREIHLLSPRRNKEMIAVDMGAITESLFESELFGHMKGSFTDAYADRPGKFETANHSTLFLDEIGNLPYHLQAKLLTVLQRRSIVRVGSNQPIPVNIRLICATNRNLSEMVQNNEFREDLLYRINTIEIFIPPLRERGNDISLLADHFLKRYSHKYKKEIEGFSREARQLLKQYNWPGNVRELQHVIERAVILSDQKKLQYDDFMLRTPVSSYHEKEEKFNLEELEKKTIQEALHHCSGNLTQAADLLGITRTSLYRRLEKYGL